MFNTTFLIMNCRAVYATTATSLSVKNSTINYFNSFIIIWVSNSKQSARGHL